jgi:hypothetical protein
MCPFDSHIRFVTELVKTTVIKYNLIHSVEECLYFFQHYLVLGLFV